MPPAPADLDDDFDRDDTPEPEAGPRPRHTPVDVLALPVLPGAEGATQADYDRPTRWEHCIAPEGPNAARPCPWLSCREHALHVLSGEHPVQRAIVHAERLVRFAGLAPGSEPPADTPAGEAAAEAERVTLQWLGEVPFSCTLDGAEDGATLADIGDTIGVSRERVRQIETLGLIACACASTIPSPVPTGEAHGARAAQSQFKAKMAVRARYHHPDAEKPRSTVDLDAQHPRYDPDAVRATPPLTERMAARKGIRDAIADTRIDDVGPVVAPLSRARTVVRSLGEGDALRGPAPPHLAHLPHPTTIVAPADRAWCPTIRAEVTGRLCVLRHRARQTDLARADDNPNRFTYRECAECPWAATMDAAFGPEANRTPTADPLPGSGDPWTVRVERGRPGAGGFRLPVYDQPPGRGRSRGLGARTPGRPRDTGRIGAIAAPPVTPVATTRRLPRQPDAPDCVVPGCPNTARRATRPDPPTEGMCAVHTVNTQGMVHAYRDRALPGAAVRHYLVTRGTLHGSTAWCREVGILTGPAPRTGRAAPVLPALYDTTGRPLGAEAPTPDLAFLAALRGPVEPAGAAPAPPATTINTTPDPVTPKDNPTMPATATPDTAHDPSAPLQCTARGCTATEYVAARGKAWGGLCHHHGKKARGMAYTYRIDPGPVVQFVRNNGTTDGVTAYLRTAGIIPPAERTTAAVPPKPRARSVAYVPVDASPATTPATPAPDAPEPITPAPVTVTAAPGAALPVEAIITPAGFVSGEVGPVRYTLAVAVDPEALRLLSLGQRMGYARAIAMLEGLSALAALPPGTVTAADLSGPRKPA